jgi:hypothetical protein
MPLHLKDPKTVPGIGFTYIEPSTGRQFGGMFSFSYVVGLVVAYRKGNNLPRSSPQEVSEDVDSYMCRRDPSLCYDPAGAVATYLSKSGGGGCSTCGIVTT